MIIGKKLLGFFLILALCLLASFSAQAQNRQLFLAYPPLVHQTVSDRIFLIGTAPKTGKVLVNGKAIKRSRFGHFAPSMPLVMGKNEFQISYKDQNLKLVVNRNPLLPVPPTDLGFIIPSLTPKVSVSRLPNEDICFEAIATVNAKVTVKLGEQLVELNPSSLAQLPANSQVLVGDVTPISPLGGLYQGCTKISQIGTYGQPQYRLSLGDRFIDQKAPGNVTVAAPTQVAEVIINEAIARTGPSSDFSRLTPLPQSTTDQVTGKEGDWLRLSYGGWVNRQSVRLKSQNFPPTSLVRALQTRQVLGWTELRIPLQVPVPISIDQGDRQLVLTLHNVTAQTNTNLVNDDPVLARLDWQQAQPNQIQYRINLKSSQQWGYKLKYEGTTLVLALRHPPQIRQNSLKGIKILLDAGHGSPADLGARGPTGYPEKDVTLIVAKLLQQQLQTQGATVIMTRTADQDIFPQPRADLITKTEPAIALSIHYNALPDHGDAENTQGIGMFWYHPQSHNLAVHLHNYLTKDLNRPSYGIFWNDLALARPTVAPSVLLELGFMIHPEEFEWIIDSNAQKKLVASLTRAIATWILNQS